MNDFLIFLISLFLLNSVILFFYTFGYLVFFSSSKFALNHESLKKYFVALPLLGFSIIAILFNYFYFLFDLPSVVIFYLSIFFFLFIFSFILLFFFFFFFLFILVFFFFFFFYFFCPGFFFVSPSLFFFGVVFFFFVW